jgi:tetratricopeptide (TPR) repeat protein
MPIIVFTPFGNQTMEPTAEYSLLAAVAALLAAAFGALWLFRRRVAADRQRRDERVERALVSARKAARQTAGKNGTRRHVRAQMQLAMLLAEAAGRRPDRARFEEALSLLDEAIPVLRNQRLTPELATAIYYKGRAEWGMAGLEPGWQRLESAVATFRELLEVTPWPRHLLRGVVISLPAVILVDIGDRRDDPTTMAEGLALAREAVAAARKRVPIDRSIARRNLSHTLGVIGRKTANREMLEEAIEVARAAIEDIKEKTFPGHWAACHANLGFAMGSLGEVRADAALLEESLAVMDAARQSEDPDGRPEGRVMLAQNSGGIRLALGRLRRDPRTLRQAIADLHESLNAFTELSLPFGQAETARMLGQALTALGEMQHDREMLAQAADCFRWALRIFQDGGATRHVAETLEAMRILEHTRDNDGGTKVAPHQPLYIVR